MGRCHQIERDDGTVCLAGAPSGAPNMPLIADGTEEEQPSPQGIANTLLS